MRELDGLAKGDYLKFYKRLYTPWVTLLAFIGQVLDSDGSCRQAVSRIAAQLSLHPHGPAAFAKHGRLLQGAPAVAVVLYLDGDRLGHRTG